MTDSLRESLDAGFSEYLESDQGQQSSEQSQAVETLSVADSVPGDKLQTQRERDEVGRFSAKAKDQAQDKAANAPIETAAPESLQGKPDDSTPTGQPLDLKYPTTWKKESAELLREVTQWMPPQKAKQLVDYLNQRESEFTSGVSTYRAEAMQAKELTDAIAPFVAEIERNGAKPAQWLANIGNTHYALVNGNPQQKLEAFAKLAQDYGVPLHGVAQAEQGQYDPILMQQMQQNAEIENRITSMQKWQQEQENRSLEQQINAYRANPEFKHFDAVAPEMARMLETGYAKNIEQAYALAVRVVENLAGNTPANIPPSQPINATQPATQPTQSKQAIAAAARGAAISPKSGARSSSSPVDPKNLRGALEHAVKAHESGRI